MLAAVLIAGLCVSGCASLGFRRYPYTKEASRRPDQEWWIKEDLALILAHHLAHASMADPDHVDPAVSRKLQEVMAICYRHGSFGGKDLDGGVRAMNFFKNAYFSANGDYWTWRAAVRSVSPAFSATPAEEQHPRSSIPEGYR